MREAYDVTFFQRQSGESYGSACAVMPRVLSLCEPRSVADFGCGVGTWLHACQELGIRDVTGIDGSYVDERMLQIPVDRFVKTDLALAIDLRRQFDLVLSLEVGEHLPPRAAATFVGTLTRHAPIVLFSAAVPTQGGVHHINERPAGYWASLFADRGYRCLDCLRDIFWNDDHVAWWYRQNMLLFVKREALENYPHLVAETSRPRKFPLDVIHPEMLAQRGLSTLLREFSPLARQAIRRAFRKTFSASQVAAPLNTAKVRSIR